MAHLLLVDNDARIVELTGWFLERAGHRVTSAFSYAAARELLEAQSAERPELLLADLELGAERGREELPRLAAAGLLPPTLVVSGFLDVELERELLAIPGVVGTLAKPVDLATLEARVVEALENVADRRAPLPELPPDAEQVVQLIPTPPPSAPVRFGEGIAPESTPARSTPPDDEGWIEILPDGPQRAS